MPNLIIQEINNELLQLQNELDRFRSTVAYLNGAREAVNTAVAAVNLSEIHFDEKVRELKSTYDSIVGLSQTVSSVVSDLNAINVSRRLDTIEGIATDVFLAVDETNKQIVDKINKIAETVKNTGLDDKLKDLKGAVGEAVKAIDTLGNRIEGQQLGKKIVDCEENISERLRHSHNKIENTTRQISTDLTKTIADLNLPNLIDKLNTNILGVQAIVGNLQVRVDNVERNLNKTLKDSNEEQKNTLNEMGKNLIYNIQNTRSEIVVLEQKMLEIDKQQKNRMIITWVLLVVGFTALIVVLKN